MKPSKIEAKGAKHMPPPSLFARVKSKGRKMNFKALPPKPQTWKKKF
jgi:hypothetical protein